jgi:hypothetical protein
MKAMTARDKAFARRRRWLVWSPTIVLPLGFLVQLFVDREFASSAVGLFWLAFAWCYVAPFAYGILGAFVRASSGRRTWPEIEIACLWLVTSVLTTLVLFVLGAAAAALGVLP